MPDYSEHYAPNSVMFRVGVTNFQSSRKVKRRDVKFKPSAGTDIICIREVGEDADPGDWPATYLHANGMDTSTVGCLFHDETPNYIYIDLTKSTLSVPRNVRITFGKANTP